jgi:hypothetical protein
MDKLTLGMGMEGGCGNGRWPWQKEQRQKSQLHRSLAAKRAPSDRLRAVCRRDVRLERSECFRFSYFGFPPGIMEGQPGPSNTFCFIPHACLRSPWGSSRLFRGRIVEAQGFPQFQPGFFYS